MKYNSYILFGLTLTSFTPKKRESNSFTVHIDYCGLPSATHYDYLIKDNKVSVKKYFHSLPDRPEIVYDKKMFKIKNIDSLSSHIIQIDWTKIPKEIDRKCIDGYYYNVTITRVQDTFNFKVNCSGHPDLDKLLDLCNSTIPNRKYRDKFKLWHDN